MYYVLPFLALTILGIPALSAQENANDLRSAHGDRGVSFGDAHGQTLLSKLIRV